MNYEEAKYIVTQLQDEYASYNDERSIIAEALVIAKEAIEYCLKCEQAFRLEKE